MTGPGHQLPDRTSSASRETVMVPLVTVRLR